MPNTNLTEIVVVLDESGSMGSIRDDTIGGFNTMLKDQQANKDGKALLTLVTFSSSVRTVISGRDINEVEPLSDKSYRPGGGTALLDAIGQTIEALETRYEDAEDENIPANVMFIIITDGEENSSRQYKKGQIEKMIKHQTKRHGYDFVFLGANLDAVGEGDSIGVNNSFNFAAHAGGIADTYEVLSKTTSMYRGGLVGEAAIQNAMVTNMAGTSLEGMNQNITVNVNNKPDFNADALDKAVKDALKQASKTGKGAI